MLKLIYRSCIATLLLSILLCGAYPLCVTVIGKLLFAEKANGQIISVKNNPVGSVLIGQVFTKPEYFHGRPSSAGPGGGYDAANSSGSNLGPTHSKLEESIRRNIDQVLKDNPHLKKGEIPVDLVTSSASGLDPHISPTAAEIQVDRIAISRKIKPQEVQALIQQYTDHPQLLLLGEPVVNVLLLNIALDHQYPKIQTAQ